MERNKKSKVPKIVLWTLGISILIGIMAQLLFAQMVRRALEDDLPENIQLTYGKLSTNVLLGRIRLRELSLSAENGRIDLKSESLTVSGLHYPTLLRNGDLRLSDLELETPRLTYGKGQKDSTVAENKGPQKNISIGTLGIRNGQLELYREETDSLWAKIGDMDISLHQVALDGDSKSEIPFTLGSYRVKTGKGTYDMGPWERLHWKALHLDPQRGHIQGLRLGTKYGKEELSRKLATERDHYTLEVDSIALEKPELGRSKFHVAALQLYRPMFGVYRDKLLPDDTTHKKLFNQLLRDLEMDLRVDTLAILEGSLSYGERLEAALEPEELRFTDISATITNLHNSDSGLVCVDIGAQLMGDGPFTLNWSFDPQNPSNDFLASGSLYKFDSANISPFMRSNLSVEVQGRIDRLYFTISGNEVESQGDMKMDYAEFGFVVLKKDRLGVNKLLTALVNLFAKDGDRDDPDGFRHGHFKVERKTDRSFFNYLWLNIKEGLVATLTGPGKKPKK